MNATANAAGSGHMGGRAGAARSGREMRRGRARVRGPHAGVWPGLALFLCVAASIIAIGALPTLADPVRPPASSHGVVVGVSESLWSIAEDNRVPGVPTSEMVAAIRRLNGIGPSDTLDPGRVVRVPVVEEQSAALALR